LAFGDFKNATVTTLLDGIGVPVPANPTPGYNIPGWNDRLPVK